ncbi:MAG: hypothetical protein JJU02_01700 [Cryomorphaceae bacterium]|nr:hypothetical protein [Cryomorphaceae bacterium]
MKNKIILSELEKILFPEYFPYFKRHFQNEESYLKIEGEKDKLSLQNIAYKIKVANYSASIKDLSVRYILHQIFTKHVDNYLDWHQEYDWPELKSILMFFVFFSGINNPIELKNMFDQKPVTALFGKYRVGFCSGLK